MPQEKKRKYADFEAVTGTPARSKKYADFEQVAAPQPTQPAPAQEPEGVFSSFQTGVAGPLLRNVVETAADFYNAPGETLERVGRGALEFASAFDPAGNAYKPTVEGQAARVAELNRRADERLPEPIKSIKLGMELEEAKPRTRAGKVAGVVGSVLGEIAFPTAPETVAGNIITAPFGVAGARSAGKVVAPILRRIRAGRSVPVKGAAEAAEGASVRAQSGVARLESPGASQRLPTRQNLAEGPPPLLEEAPIDDFAVTLGKARESGPGARGPRFDEAFEKEVNRKLGPPPVTPAERAALLESTIEPFARTPKQAALFQGAPGEKSQAFEILSALRKAGMLTGLKTHIKNVGGTGVFQLSEEAARIPGAVIDAAVSRVTKQRTLTGPSLGSMGRSAMEAATKGIREAKEILRTGRTTSELEGLQEIATNSKVLNTYVNGVFRLLKAEDKLFKSYAIRRSLEDRARSLALTEMRQGKIVRGQVGERTKEILKAPPADLANAAILDGEIATFNNPNRFATAANKAIEELAPNQRFAVDLVVPFRKTPTNIVAKMIEYSPLGFVKNVGQAAKLANGILKKSFTAEQQRAFSQTFGRASFGSALMALGYVGYRDGWLTGLQEDDTSRRSRDVAAGRTPGAILINGTWHQLSGFAPLGNILAIGASLARETEQEQEGWLEPATKIAAQAIGEQPLLIGTQQIASALKEPGTTSERLLGGLAGSFVPTAVADVAQLVDPAQREARGVLPQVQKRIPGASFGLPEAQNVLGQPKEDRATAFFDPTRTSTDVAQRDPLMRELVRLDAGISGFQREEGEADDAYRARVQAFGQLYTRYGQQLVSSPVYQRANDEIKLRAVKSLNDRAKDAVREGRTSPGNLAPAALIGAAIGAENRENRKNAARK